MQVINTSFAAISPGYRFEARIFPDAGDLGSTNRGNVTLPELGKIEFFLVSGILTLLPSKSDVSRLQSLVHSGPCALSRSQLANLNLWLGTTDQNLDAIALTVSPRNNQIEVDLKYQKLDFLAKSITTSKFYILPSSVTKLRKIEISYEFRDPQANILTTLKYSAASSGSSKGEVIVNNADGQTNSLRRYSGSAKTFSGKTYKLKQSTSLPAPQDTIRHLLRMIENPEPFGTIDRLRKLGIPEKQVHELLFSNI